ncbi:protein HEXIM1 isoform X2 [Hyalella azteca]|uniref:Protein HEXIM1 isoform X2 n=1 Tax=Hyalella azteca TaxID=294128 RepID=A0A979FWQ2_HYAAZ|nr:protein HEXIM1 isoform X2 [Hyalella azteca]
MDSSADGCVPETAPNDELQIMTNSTQSPSHSMASSSASTNKEIPPTLSNPVASSSASTNKEISPTLSNPVASSSASNNKEIPPTLSNPEASCGASTNKEIPPTLSNPVASCGASTNKEIGLPSSKSLNGQDLSFKSIDGDAQIPKCVEAQIKVLRSVGLHSKLPKGIDLKVSTATETRYCQHPGRRRYPSSRYLHHDRFKRPSHLHRREKRSSFKKKKKRRTKKLPCPVLRPFGSQVPRAPENSTQFIMDNHEDSNLFFNFDSNNVSSAAEDESFKCDLLDAYSQAEFETLYRSSHEESLMNSTMVELKTAIIHLESRCATLEHKIASRPSVLLDSLQSSLIKLQEENRKLRQEHQQLLNPGRKSRTSGSSSSSMSGSSSSNSDSDSSSSSSSDTDEHGSAHEN